MGTDTDKIQEATPFTQIPSGLKKQIDVHTVVQGQLDRWLNKIEDCLQSHVLASIGVLSPGHSKHINDAAEWQCHFGHRKKYDKLTVILETTGGNLEPVEHIQNTLRSLYATVDFIVPKQAFSAGTALVLSGNNIYMNYNAALGPVDPQVQIRPNRASFPETVSGIGYQEQFNELMDELKGQGINFSPGLLQYLCDKFNPVELYRFKQQVELAKRILTSSLTAHYCNHSQEKDPHQQAKCVAAQLANANTWHSHACRLTPNILRSQLKLHVEDLRTLPGYLTVLRYWQVFDSYAALTQHKDKGAIHVRTRLTPKEVNMSCNQLPP